MARLIVHSEVVYGILRDSPNPNGVSFAVAVSVTGDTGEPIKGLGIPAFKICAIIPPPHPPQFTDLKVFVADEQKPGLYVLGLDYQNAKAPIGKYIFSVKVTQGKNLGETLTTMEL